MSFVDRKHLYTIAKLIFVSAVLFYVFQSIQWRDQLQQLDPQGHVVLQQSGSIVGRWDGATVDFLHSDGTSEIINSADGSGKHINPGLVTYLKNIHIPLFLAGCLFFGFSILFSGTRWWWLLRVNGLMVGWCRALRYTWIGLFCNNFIPGLTGGDLIRAVYVMRYCHHDKVRSVFSVIFDRILGLGSLVSLGALVTLFQVDRFPMIAALVWSFLFLSLGFMILLFSRRIRHFFRLDRLLVRLPVRISRLLSQLNEVALLYRNHYRALLLWWLAGMLNHGFVVVGTLFIGWSLNVGMPANEYFVLVPVINIVSSIPVAPNGWGIGEALFGNLFSLYGAGYLEHVASPELVMRTRAVALSILFRSQTMVWSLLGGFFMLMERGKRPEPGEIKVLT